MAKAKLVKLKKDAILIYQRDRKNNYSSVGIGFSCGHCDNVKNGTAHFFGTYAYERNDNRRQREDERVENGTLSKCQRSHG